MFREIVLNLYKSMLSDEHIQIGVLKYDNYGYISFEIINNLARVNYLDIELLIATIDGIKKELKQKKTINEIMEYIKFFANELRFKEVNND